MCAGVSGAQETGCESPDKNTKLTLQSRHHGILGRSSTGKLMSYVGMKIE